MLCQCMMVHSSMASCSFWQWLVPLMLQSYKPSFYSTSLAVCTKYSHQLGNFITSWSSCLKHSPPPTKGPMNHVITCNKQEKIWQEEEILWDDEEKETKNADTNLPGSIDHLLGWLLCGKSPLHHFPPTLQGNLHLLHWIPQYDSKSKIQNETS